MQIYLLKNKIQWSVTDGSSHSAEIYYQSMVFFSNRRDLNR